MALTPAEIQQALRISKAVQQHLEQVRIVNVDSKEIYSVVADLGLIERDVEKGHHLRLFLKKLVKENMLVLIPQCKAMAKSGGKYDFIFNSAADRMPARRTVAEEETANSK